MMYLFWGLRHGILSIVFVFTVLFALPRFWVAIVQITAGINFPRRGRGPCTRRATGFDSRQFGSVGQTLNLCRYAVYS